MAKDVKFNIRLVVDGKAQVVTASADIKELSANVGEVYKNVTKSDRAFSRWTQKTMAFSSAANAISQLSGVLNDITEENRNFSKAMLQANTMAGEGKKGFADLKDEVADLAKEVPMARDELANGLYQVISNGVPKDNWISYLRSSARSAVGGIAEVGEVVKVTSTIIKNYGLDWSAAQDIQDKIQLTAKNGVTSFEQLAAALPSVTGQAAQLGVSLTEMLAVMSTLTGVTGNTAEVSTQLASVLTALTKESSKSQKMAQAMGIEFNAASVKAAGGLRNYLMELDKTVTAYAQSTGELKESIYAKLFGRAEALRLVNALTGQLAGKFDENIKVLDNSAGTMDAAFADMSSTGSATIQMLKNQTAAITDLIAGVIGGIQPYINFTAQMGMTLMSVMSLTAALKGMNVMQGLSTVSSRALGVAMAIPGNVAKSVRAWVLALSISFKASALSADTLKIAMRGLMVATGVGAAIAAVTMIIEHFVNTTDEAKDSTDDLTDSMNPVKQAYVDAKSAIMQDISALKAFHGTQAEEKKMVDGLNQKYGDTLGYFDSVSQWYKALTADSEAYCRQMVREAEIRELANQTAKLELQKRGILYNKDGSTRKYSTKRKHVGDNAGLAMGPDYVQFGYGREIVGSSDLEKATAQVRDLDNEITAKKKRMGELISQRPDYKMRGHEAPTGHSHAAPAGAGTGGHTTTRKGQGTANTTSTDHEDNLTKNSIAYYEKQISDLRDKAENIDLKLEPQVYQETMRQVAELEQKVEAIRKSAGQDIHTPGDVDGKPGRLTDNLPEIDTNIELPTIPDNIPKDAATAADAVNGLTGAFQGLGQAMGGSAQGWLSWGANVVSTVWSTLPALEALINALFAKSAADSVEQNSKLGPFGWVAGIAAALSVVAAMASLPKFAEGGLAYGPTLGLFGEYSGASHNPEVVAPLDKLRGLLAPAQGGGTARVEFVARGRDLVGVLANETRIGSKSGVRTKIKL